MNKKKTVKSAAKKGRPPKDGRVYVTRSVSFDPVLKEKAEDRAKELGFRSFSEYLSRLMERDIINRGTMFIEPTRND